VEIDKINEEDLIKFFSLFNILCAALKCEHVIPGEILKILVEALKGKGIYTKEDDDWAKGVADKYKKRIAILEEEKAKFFSGDDPPVRVRITFEERWDIFWKIASPSPSPSPSSKQDT